MTISEGGLLKLYEVPELFGRVFQIGIRDSRRRNLRGVKTPIRRGTTYNSYLILGKKNASLVDTVPEEHAPELIDKINQLTNVEDLEYILLTSSNPMRTGALEQLMNRAKKASILGGGLCARELHLFPGAPANRIKTLVNHETTLVSCRKIEAVRAPTRHDPTNTAYCLEDNGMLFSGGFFSGHSSSGICNEDVCNILTIARDYFRNEIEGFGPGLKAFDDLSGRNIRVIAPAHGPVWKFPEKVIGAYRKWFAAPD